MSKSDLEAKMLPVKAFDQIKMVEAEPEPLFLFHGIPEGSMGLITGASKTGKTTFSENLGICLGTGRKTFFNMPIGGAPKKVLYINLEEGYKLRSRRMAKQIKRLNTAEVELFKQNFYVTPKDFPSFINTHKDWEKIRDLIGDCNPDVVIIDSLSHLMVGKIEESRDAQRFFQQLNKYVRRDDLTVIVVHHTVKGNDKPMIQDNIAGSRFILQEFEYALGLSKIPSEIGGNYATMLFNKHMHNDENEAKLYKINPDGWVEYVDKANKYSLYAESRTDRRTRTGNQERILSFMKKEASKASKASPGIKTQRFYETLVKTGIMSKTTFHEQMDKLIGLNQVIQPERGFYTFPNDRKANDEDINTFSKKDVLLLKEFN